MELQESFLSGDMLCKCIAIAIHGAMWQFNIALAIITTYLHSIDRCTVMKEACDHSIKDLVLH